jgi:hypothetical protein
VTVQVSAQYIVGSRSSKSGLINLECGINIKTTVPFEQASILGFSNVLI